MDAHPSPQQDSNPRTSFPALKTASPFKYVKHKQSERSHDFLLLIPFNSL